MKKIGILLVAVFTINIAISQNPEGTGGWTKQTSGTTYDLFCVHFANANNGYIVGDYGTILMTTNGGISWALHSYITKTVFTDYRNHKSPGKQKPSCSMVLPGVGRDRAVDDPFLRKSGQEDAVRHRSDLD